MKTKIMNRTLFCFALISLAAAYWYGWGQARVKLTALVHERYATATPIQDENRSMFCIQKNGRPAYLLVEKEQGWAGPMDIAVEISKKGRIQAVKVLHHCETPSFFNRLTRKKYLEQFTGKAVNAPFEPGIDIDGVSGATISSKAIARAVAKAGHWTAESLFKLPLEPPSPQGGPGKNEICLMGLYLLVVAGIMGKARFRKGIRRISLGLGLVFLGFYAGFPLSLSHISALALGMIPSLATHMFWWLLLGGALIFLIAFGKNIYCSWICPFGALQELLSRISDLRIKIHPKVIKHGKKLPVFLTWLSLMIIFIFRNPALGNYEPFGAMFNFEGQGTIWFILPLVILAALFIPRFWCRFFCPVGCVLNHGNRFRNHLFIRRKPNEK